MEVICTISGKPCRCGTVKSCQHPNRALADRHLARAVRKVEELLLEATYQGELNSHKHPLPELREVIRKIEDARTLLDEL